MPVGKPRQEECWIKKNKVESLDHTFMVWNLKEELEKHTKNVEVNITEKADLIFKDKQGKDFAVEVETGKGFKKHRSRLVEKFLFLFFFGKFVTFYFCIVASDEIDHPLLQAG